MDMQFLKLAIFISMRKKSWYDFDLKCCSAVDTPKMGNFFPVQNKPPYHSLLDFWAMFYSRWRYYAFFFLFQLLLIVLCFVVFILKIAFIYCVPNLHCNNSTFFSPSQHCQYHFFFGHCFMVRNSAIVLPSSWQYYFVMMEVEVMVVVVAVVVVVLAH